MVETTFRDIEWIENSTLQEILEDLLERIKALEEKLGK